MTFATITIQYAFRPYPTDGFNLSGSLIPWQPIPGTPVGATPLIYATRNNVWINDTTIEQITLFYNVSSGLYSSTGSSGPWVNYDESQVRTTNTSPSSAEPETTQELTQVFNFGLGDLDIEFVRLGQTKIEQFKGVTTSRAALQSDAGVMGVDTAHPNPPYGGNTWKLNCISVDGGELRQNANVNDSGWVKRDFYGTNCEFIQVDLSGRLYFNGGSGPEIRTCVFEIAYRIEGAAAWTLETTLTLSNGDAFPVRETFGWPVALGFAYEVRVRKTTPDSVDARDTSDFEFRQVKFFRPEPVEVDTPFTQHPAQNRYAVAVRASGQISGVINNLNAYVYARCWRWTGAANSTPTTPIGADSRWVWGETESPADWYLYYAMGGFRKSSATPGHPLNGKGWILGPAGAEGPRMFGGGVPDSAIDLDALWQWKKFCTQYNLRFNAVLREQSNVAEVLTRIARIGRASPTWQMGKLGVVWEDPLDVPTAVFGMNSIVAGSMSITYIGHDSPDEIVASFTNPDDDWKDDEVRKLVPGTVLPNSEATISLFGCKYKAQAQREVNLLAARQFYQRRRVTFETSQEGLPILRGDVILLGHDMTDWAISSRVAEVSGSTLTLVRAVERLNNPTWHVLVRKPDGTFVSGTATPQPPPIPSTILQLNGGWTPVVLSEFPDAVPEDWTVHLSTTPDVGKRMRVIGCDATDGRRVLITCTDERPEMYNYEISGTPDTPGPPQEQLASRVSDLSVQRDSCTGNVRVTWRCINCRGATITIAGAPLNVVGESLNLGNLPPGSLSVHALAFGTEIDTLVVYGDLGVFAI